MKILTEQEKYVVTSHQFDFNRLSFSNGRSLSFLLLVHIISALLKAFNTVTKSYLLRNQHLCGLREA